MSVVQVNVYEAKTQLSKLLERVAAGDRVVIAKAGKPVADLIMHQPVEVQFGTMKGQIHYDEDAFDWPDPEIAAMFYGDDAAS